MDGHSFMSNIFENMNSQAMILIIDQTQIKKFDDARKEWALDRRMECLHTDNYDPLEVPEPPPSSFACRVLDKTDRRWPRKYYYHSWILLRKI